MPLRPATHEAYELLQRGCIAMADIEAAGIRIDTDYLDKAIDDVCGRIKQAEAELRETDLYKLWQKHYGSTMKLDATGQLAHIVFKVMGCRRSLYHEQDKNDEIAYKHLISDIPELSKHFEARKLRKALTGNLYGIKKETVNGYIHPFFDLHTVESYRSSSSRINFQNQHVRNKLIAQIVRSCVIPRNKGNVLLEMDYGAQEVRVSVCYNKDPVLRDYIVNDGDMHRDMAKELYILTDEQLGPSDKGPGKLVRYAAKNKFVFPGFYGSDYISCAPNLWDAITELDLKRADGVSMHEHLAENGINRLGLCDRDTTPASDSFEKHVKAVEHDYWYNRYSVYTQWKKDWWNLYNRQGGVNTLTGFRLFGIFRRTQILCDPIQGSAFHCLLWSVIHIQEEFRKRKMRAKIICQIHDSALVDCPQSELSDVIEIMHRWSVREVSKHWSWITVPLATEFELAKDNWYNKKTIDINLPC